MTLDEIKKDDWYKTRPLIIQQAINKLPPIGYYQFKDTGYQCYIVSYREPINGELDDVTVLVQKTGRTSKNEILVPILHTNQVFDVKLDSLEEWTGED